MSSTPLQPGAIVGGKYRLDRLLGQGGMGSVFAAENTLTGKLVAIKCMHQEIASNPDASKRFLREAKASARIRHPNVVDVYDVLSEREGFFLVMEYLDGEPLSALMDREETSLPHLIKLLVGAMRGVAAAHRHGIIHRDIKPENIFLSNEGDDRQVVPKVLDFGISKLSDTADVALTAPGSTLGTILYMSTEQLTGASDIDGRADVYAFGVILYQAVTGRAPFDSDTLSVLILRIMTELPVPVKQVRPDVPLEFARLIEAAMAKQRDARIASMDAFIAALEPFADERAFRQQLALGVNKVPQIRTPNSVARSIAPPQTAAQLAELQQRALQTLAGSSVSSLAATAMRLSPAPLRVSSAPPRIPRNPMRHVPLVVLGLLGLVVAGWWLLWPASGDDPGRGVGAVAHEQQAHVVTPAPVSGADADPQPTAAADPPAAPRQQHDAASARPRPVVGTLSPQPSAARPSGATGAARKAPLPARDKPLLEPPVVLAPPLPEKPAPRPGCNPNFYFDAQGDKHFKPECF